MYDAGFNPRMQFNPVMGRGMGPNQGPMMMMQMMMMMQLMEMMMGQMQRGGAGGCCQQMANPAMMLGGAMGLENTMGGCPQPPYMGFPMPQGLPNFQNYYPQQPQYRNQNQNYDSGSCGPVRPLSGNDQQTAEGINNYFRSKNSPACQAGDVGGLCVELGKKYDMDPRILVAIAGQETNYGKTGIGANGMLGVGAYDNDPNNATRNSHFSGVEHQLTVGAQTFAKLRAKGGAGPDSPIDQQIATVNRAGWATDPNWHTGVSNIFHQVSQQVA